MSHQAITPTKLKRPKAERHQRGYIYEAHNAFHVRYYVNEIVNGVPERVQRSKRLCDKNRNTGHGSPSAKAVQILAEDHMRGINTAVAPTRADMPVTEFWEKIYLPHCEKVLPLTGQPRLKASTLRGYKTIWKTHLSEHFGSITLQRYDPDRASMLLDSLTGSMNSTSLKHLRAVASAIFKRAVKEKLLKVNPWAGVPMPDDAIEPKNTAHYTPEQAEDMVTALVDHVDAQLVLTLACFLGLGPAEISGLQWNDIDSTSIHIRRNRIRGEATSTKNKWRAASLPIIDQVRVPLELWRAKCEDTSDEGWLIPDLHNLTGRVIIPHVKGDRECVRCAKTPKPSGVTWVGLYGGRRGAITMALEATGNVAVAQRLARHKTADTTLRVYNKGISEKGFLTGMQTFQKSLSK
jgi:integrase